MTPTLVRAATVALACVALSGPLAAESLASSASVSGSASVGSVSDSVHRSSDSSSRKTPVAAGDYRIIHVAELADRPGLMRLTLHAQAAPSPPIWLDLPRETFVRHGLAPEMTVSVHHRAYGLAFAHADTREPFFLALADDWHGELEARAVKL